MKSDDDFAYMSYGANCTEVEIDVLTGEVEVLRSDILFDCGQRCVISYPMRCYSFTNNTMSAKVISKEMHVRICTYSS